MKVTRQHRHTKTASPGDSSSGEEAWEVRLALFQHHLKLARIFVSELLEEEVEEKAVERYSQDKPHDGHYSRWGTTDQARIGTGRAAQC